MRNKKRKYKKIKRFIPRFEFKPMCIEIITDNSSHYPERLPIKKIEYAQDYLRVTVISSQES